MKLWSVPRRASAFYHKIQRQLLRYAPSRFRHSTNGPISGSLYRRLSPLGDPNVSMMPVLDDWIRQGNPISKGELQRIINELSNYKRHKHALEVSLWMTNKRSFPVSPFDVAVRLKLIDKAIGLEQAENYFNKVPENLRTHSVYIALLNCYTRAKSVDKAESIMQEARDLGYATKSIWYNLMMNMHYQLKNRGKLRDLLAEMELKGIHFDSFTLSICLSESASAADASGMDKIVRIMESNPQVCLHWRTYVVAVEGYLKMGSIDKALVMLNKLEGQLPTFKRNSIVFVFLLKLYAEAGKRDDLYRIWNLYKQKCKVENKVYVSMIRSLIKFDGINGAEEIFEEWESSGLQFDFRVANFLIDAYCTAGDLEKAEGLLAKGVSKGGDPLVITWCHLAGGYLKRNLVSVAMEALQKAVSIYPPSSRHVSRKDCLITCLEYLEHGNDVEKAEELINILRMENILKEDASDDGSIEDDEMQLCGRDQNSGGVSVTGGE